MAEPLFNQLIRTILKIYFERHPETIKKLKTKKEEEPQDFRKYIEEISKDKKRLLKQV